MEANTIDELLKRARLMEPTPCADRERYVAELSFKAGQEERDKEWNEWKDRAMVVAISNAMLKGRREVVEWLREHPGIIDELRDVLPRQLKKWGIK